MSIFCFPTVFRCRTKEEVQNNRTDLHPTTEHGAASRRAPAALLGADGLNLMNSECCQTLNFPTFKGKCCAKVYIFLFYYSFITQITVECLIELTSFKFFN